MVSVIEDEKKGTARVILQNPPVNALNTELLVKLSTIIKDLEERKFRGFILESASPKVFCAGLDISELYNPSEEKITVLWKAFQTLWKTLYLTPLITVAAINGHAPAGGCVLALSCDHGIMVKSGGIIGLNETLLGFPAPKWVQLLLVNACKLGKAEHSLKISKLFTPQEAVEHDIVNELVDSSYLHSKAEEAMDKFLSIPVSSFTKTKLSMRKPFVDDLISYQERDLEDVVGMFLHSETQKMIGKYLESLKNKKK
ncbi:enoyl-CoA delta isomerase 1, mitochondrial [Nephila pilipes]|uniref:Enoyl-CoA delta isomerase 1, mitochondrial n=1 Tax=Nephila pilipes TaxID=299642 RepID=A0A8X6TH08_NEPPI|nr:enoyl-CoA delta isomerase 1, mitochondrial [Nephila pilipes]